MKISLKSFLCFSFVFFSKHSSLCNKKKITCWLEHMKFIFSWKKKFTREIFFLLEDKLHMFAPSCNILYMFVVRCCSYVKVHIVFFVTVGEPIRFTDLYNYIRPQRIFVNALSTLMHFRLETHPFFMRFRLPPTQIQSKTKVSGKDF